MTECPNGQERLTAQQMIEAENLLSQMDQVTEFLLALDQEPTKDCLFLNSVKSVLSHPISLKKLLLDLLTLSHQIKSLQLNLRPKGEKDTSTSLARQPKHS